MGGHKFSVYNFLSSTNFYYCWMMKTFLSVNGTKYMYDTQITT